MERLPPWLEAPYERLEAALDAGRLGHALLFHGGDGWGQLRLASALALAVIGRPIPRSGETHDPVDPAKLAHPDLRWLEPGGAGAQIRIDDIRALGHFIMQTPQIAARKVALVADAGAINMQAANALLKTLEEPPPGSHLLLVASTLAELPATIRSRCQLVAVRPADTRQALDWVRSEAPQVEPQVLEALGFELGHAPLRLLDALSEGAGPVAEELTEALRRDDALAPLIDAWAPGRSDGLLERWMRYVAQALRARHEGGQARLEPLAGLPVEALQAFWEEALHARRLLRGTGNPNARLLLERLLLRWRELGRTSEAAPVTQR